jgi:sugar phosphate isomerase/epimerase
MASVPVALQLYTVRNETAKDFIGTLKQVAAIGYRGVELAGMGGLSAGELKAALDDLDVRVVGSHIPMERLENELEQVFEENRILDNRFIVMPWLPDERRKTSEQWYKIAETLNTVGAAAKAQGFQLCYHHHDFELIPLDGGQTPFDIIFGYVSPELVHVEVDVYWAKFAGHDPAALIRHFNGRVPLVHLKDMSAEDPRKFAEVGAGILDFKAIFEAAEEGGIQAYIVERDDGEVPPLESAKISLQNLGTMLG